VSLPLPPFLVSLGLDSVSSSANLSLSFFKGVDTYEIDPDTGATRFEQPDGKAEAQRRLAKAFKRGPHADYAAHVERRKRALELFGAAAILRTSETRLIIGLGLAHPTETGLLLDRLTSCPYLPGSTVKGLLRAAARMVAAGDLEGDQGYWCRHLDTVFGPAIGPDTTPARGGCIFFDAFPDTWPELEADVLTPHFQDYYASEHPKPPGDWSDPVPVTFLTLAPRQHFTFFFKPLVDPGGTGDLLSQLEVLLDLGLTWLGIGAKTSAGYGYFGGSPAVGAGAGGGDGVDRFAGDEEVWPDLSAHGNCPPSAHQN